MQVEKQGLARIVAADLKPLRSAADVDRPLPVDTVTRVDADRRSVLVLLPGAVAERGDREQRDRAEQR